MSAQNPCLPANPDITGLGVRISFYVQTIALVLLTARSLDEALNSVWTLLGTSLGLAISAFVTAVTNQLPLYQAVVATDLIWLANYSIFMALATYNRHPRNSHTVQYTAIGQTYISMACILYLWIRAPTLDNHFTPQGPESKVFVVLFKTTNATGAGRTIALVMTTLMLIGYTVVAALFLSRRVASWRKQRTNRKGSTGSRSSSTLPQSPPPPTQLPMPESLALVPRPAPVQNHRQTSATALRRRGSTGSISTSTLPTPAPTTSLPSLPTTSNPPPRSPGSRTRLPPSLRLDPHLIILGVFSIVPYVITVGSTELQIQRNQLCPDNAFWGFGQVTRDDGDDSARRGHYPSVPQVWLEAAAARSAGKW
ncbi:hypothetical protein K438DRAFT_1863886 [Mycena galopus ATCC 62051]|nr:hypothetical protein K438DRAFT_1863886 [Mycena galopus ATCC 62051]